MITRTQLVGFLDGILWNLPNDMLPSPLVTLPLLSLGSSHGPFGWRGRRGEGRESRSYRLNRRRMRSAYIILSVSTVGLGWKTLRILGRLVRVLSLRARSSCKNYMKNNNLKSWKQHMRTYWFYFYCRYGTVLVSRILLSILLLPSAEGHGLFLRI